MGIQQEEPVIKDLDEAEDKALDTFDVADMMCGSYEGWQMKEMFKAGAKWQKEKLMQNAIERTVKIDAGGYPYINATELYDYTKDKPLAKNGDKVKVVFIMED